MFKRKNPFIMHFTEPDDQGGGSGDGGSNNSGEPNTPEPSDEPLGEGGLKALKAEREARSQAEKTAAEYAARIKEFEDAQKSEEEKQAERLKSLEDSAKSNELRAARYEVAAEVGLDLKAANRLQGSTREELLSDAEELKKLLDSRVPPAPKPDHSQGGGDDTKSGGVQAGRDLFRERHKSNS